jgi:hypothetical protein
MVRMKINPKIYNSPMSSNSFSYKCYVKDEPVKFIKCVYNLSIKYICGIFICFYVYYVFKISIYYT